MFESTTDDLQNVLPIFASLHVPSEGKTILVFEFEIFDGERSLVDRQFR